MTRTRHLPLLPPRTTAEYVLMQPDASIKRDRELDERRYGGAGVPHAKRQIEIFGMRLGPISHAALPRLAAECVYVCVC